MNSAFGGFFHHRNILPKRSRSCVSQRAPTEVTFSCFDPRVGHALDIYSGLRPVCLLLPYLSLRWRYSFEPAQERMSSLRMSLHLRSAHCVSLWQHRQVLSFTLGHPITLHGSSYLSCCSMSAMACVRHHLLRSPTFLPQHSTKNGSGQALNVLHVVLVIRSFICPPQGSPQWLRSLFGGQKIEQGETEKQESMRPIIQRSWSCLQDTAFLYGNGYNPQEI